MLYLECKNCEITVAMGAGNGRTNKEAAAWISFLKLREQETY
jgi:hypothetical protein